MEDRPRGIDPMLNQNLTEKQLKYNRDRKWIGYIYGRGLPHGFPHDIGLGQRPGWETGSLIAEVKIRCLFDIWLLINHSDPQKYHVYWSGKFSFHIYWCILTSANSWSVLTINNVQPNKLLLGKLPLNLTLLCDSRVSLVSSKREWLEAIHTKNVIWLSGLMSIITLCKKNKKHQGVVVTNHVYCVVFLFITTNNNNKYQ